MNQATVGSRLATLADLLIKAVSFLLVLYMIGLMVFGAPLTMISGVAMLTLVLNWPLMAYRKKKMAIGLEKAISATM